MIKGVESIPESDKTKPLPYSNYKVRAYFSSECYWPICSQNEVYECDRQLSLNDICRNEVNIKCRKKLKEK